MAKEIQAAYAVTGPVLALGDLDVGQGRDRHRRQDGPQHQRPVQDGVGDRSPATASAFAYVDTAAIVDAASAMAPAGRRHAAMPCPPFLDDIYPAWVAGAVRAKDGAFVVETRMPARRRSWGPSNNARVDDPVARARRHDRADRGPRRRAAPSSALKDHARQRPRRSRTASGRSTTPSSSIGGFDAIVGWIGEAGIAVTGTGGTVAGGLVIVPTDAAAAQRLFTQLRGVHRARAARSAGDQASPRRPTTGRRSRSSTCRPGLPAR